MKRSENQGKSMKKSSKSYETNEKQRKGLKNSYTVAKDPKQQDSEIL